MKLMKQLSIGILLLILHLSFSASITINNVHAAEEHHNLDQKQIDKYMNEELERLQIPGASIAIVKDDTIRYMNGYGIANPDGREMTAQTPVVIGSVSKSVTALAIMQLVDQGLIELDNPVQQYIPWFQLADEEASEKITIRHLLDHTSGISMVDGQRAISEGDQSITELVKSLNELNITKEVGEAYQYSNLNYNILGTVIEEVTMMSYNEYISSYVFEPLQMKNSYADPDGDTNDSIATGYQTVFGFKVPSEQLEHEANVPHGYLVSSSEDMANYMIAILNKGQFHGESILSESRINEMLQPSSIISDDFYYALGWEVQNDLVTHNGWTENTFSRVILDEEYGIVLLINSFDYFNSNHYDQIARNLYSFVKYNEPLELSEDNPSLFYIIFDLIVILLITYILFSIYKVIKQKKRKRTPIKLLLYIVYNLLFHLLIPGFILYILIKFQSISAAVLFAPGIAHALIIISILLMMIGVWNIGKLMKKA